MLQIVDHDKLNEVLAFAARAHNGQLYGGVLPYIVHPFDVMSQVIRFGECFGKYLTEASMAAALHDTFEDTDATPDDLYKLTESEITVAAVEAMTKDSSIEGKTAQIKDSVDRCLEVGTWALGVKGLDRVCNFNPATVPTHWQPSWRLDYLAEAEPLRHALSEHGPHLIHQELERAAHFYEEQARRAIDR